MNKYLSPTNYSSPDPFTAPLDQQVNIDIESALSYLDTVSLDQIVEAITNFRGRKEIQFDGVFGLSLIKHLESRYGNTHTLDAISISRVVSSLLTKGSEQATVTHPLCAWFLNGYQGSKSVDIFYNLNNFLKDSRQNTLSLDPFDAIFARHLSTFLDNKKHVQNEWFYMDFLGSHQLPLTMRVRLDRLIQDAEGHEWINIYFVNLVLQSKSRIFYLKHFIEHMGEEFVIDQFKQYINYSGIASVITSCPPHMSSKILDENLLNTFKIAIGNGHLPDFICEFMEVNRGDELDCIASFLLENVRQIFKCTSPSTGIKYEAFAYMAMKYGKTKEVIDAALERFGVDQDLTIVANLILNDEFYGSRRNNFPQMIHIIKIIAQDIDQIENIPDSLKNINAEALFFLMKNNAFKKISRKDMVKTFRNARHTVLDADLSL